MNLLPNSLVIIKLLELRVTTPGIVIKVTNLTMLENIVVTINVFAKCYIAQS